MISNLNNNTHPAFGASLNVRTVVKNGKRLANIEELFAKKTARYPQEKLIILPPEDNLGSDQVFLTEPQKQTQTFQFLIRGFDEMMENLSDNDIAKKLVRLFKSIKTEETMNTQIFNLNKKIEHLHGLSEHNATKAARFRECGDPEMAKRYETLSESNNQRAQSLTLEVEKLLERRNDILINKIAKGDPDLEENANICFRTWI